MARPERAKHLKFYVLNIKLRKRTSTKDLESSDYIRIFKKAFNDRIHTESSPGKHCIFLFMFDEKDGRKINYLSGTFAQFTFIENKDWLNINKLDLDKEFRLPDGMFPDAAITEFIFVPEAHRFCYRKQTGKSISPYPIKHFLEHALDRACKPDEFVQVDVETDKSTIDAILQSKSLKKLFIDINYSNSDISKSVKKFVEDDIKAANAKRLEITATHKPDQSLEIKNSKILRGALLAASSNGEAKATIIDENNQTKTIETTNYPLIEEVYGVLGRFNDLVYTKVINLFRRRRKNSKRK